MDRQKVLSMKVRIIKLSFFLTGFVIWVSCGDTQTRVGSITLNSCFLNYEDPVKLTEKLNEVSQKPYAPAFMVVRGCLNYQLGHYSLAEEWLKKAFQESKEEDETKGLSAGVLSLIYLKELKKQNIKPYIRHASQHPAGRWMLVLYHIDNYRETGLSQHLQKAIAQIQSKNNAEGQTSATERLLRHMLLIKEMEELCGPSAKSAESSVGTAGATGETGANGANVGAGPQNPSCQRADLEEEKLYLFSTARGFLDMFVKAPPFNNFRPRPTKKAEEEPL